MSYEQMKKREAELAAEEEKRRRQKTDEERKAAGRKKSGPEPAPPNEEPSPKAQRNFSDPESRILKTKDGFIQGYNAQAAVDGEAQVIIAHGLVAGTSDQDQLVVLIDGIKANLGRRPNAASADAGYCSEANLAALRKRRIAAYIATGLQASRPRQAKPHRPPRQGHAPEAQTGRMAKSLQAP